MERSLQNIFGEKTHWIEGLRGVLAAHRNAC